VTTPTPTPTPAPINPADRRRFDRFLLNPCYTPVTVCRVIGNRRPLQGHSYDICEGGVQFEVDHPIKPGTEVVIQITLPADGSEPAGAPEVGRTVVAYGNVVWVDNSEPGPVRMAATFSRFNEGDHERLMARLGRRQMRRAA
jgi:hypothetical protein